MKPFMKGIFFDNISEIKLQVTVINKKVDAGAIFDSWAVELLVDRQQPITLILKHGL